MGKAKMLGSNKPYIPNARGSGKHDRKAPWQGAQKTKTPAATTAKKEALR